MVDIDLCVHSAIQYQVNIYSCHVLLHVPTYYAASDWQKTNYEPLHGDMSSVSLREYDSF